MDPPYTNFGHISVQYSESIPTSYKGTCLWRDLDICDGVVTGGFMAVSFYLNKNSNFSTAYFLLKTTLSGLNFYIKCNLTLAMSPP